MKTIFRISLLLIFIFCFSPNNFCTDKNIVRPKNLNKTIVNSVTSNVVSTYQHTGFYLLADKEKGIKMYKNHSNENYNISKKPFVSIKHILRSHATKITVSGHITYTVTMVLDNKGTKDLEKVTGNPLFPYIAVVIANRLLYVVENVSKVSSGIMQVILVDYTENEVNEMVNAINKKK